MVLGMRGPEAIGSRVWIDHKKGIIVSIAAGEVSLVVAEIVQCGMVLPSG